LVRQLGHEGAIRRQVHETNTRDQGLRAANSEHAGGGRSFVVGLRSPVSCLGRMSWTEQPIFFVYFESNRLSGILEYGVVTLVRGEMVEERTRLCAATGRVRAEDIAVHGLREETLAGRLPFADDWEYFACMRERVP